MSDRHHVYITDQNHGYEDITAHLAAVPAERAVTIGDGSWLGFDGGAAGPHIGKHVTIGANSVVTGDIPDYCVAVGSPASDSSLHRRRGLRGSYRAGQREGQVCTSPPSSPR